MPQTTLCGAVSCKGVSLHSGREVSMEFRPAPENSGIVFHIHAEDGERLLLPRPEAVSFPASWVSRVKILSDSL